MEELLEKLAYLKAALDDTDCIKQIRRLNVLINNDQSLRSLIENYKSTNDERIREQIIKNALFREYKHEEAELNLLILEINKELKQITKRGQCNL